MKRIPILVFLCAAQAGAAVVVSLDTSTALLDASTYTQGTTYYSAWQLTGSGSTANTATVQAFLLGGGTGIDRQLADPVDDTYSLGPDPSRPAGIWQPSAVLSLTVNPADAFSLYTQQFVAGPTFEFEVSFTTEQLQGFAPDQFTFQLYDSGLQTLLYEVSIGLEAAEPVPEPGTWAAGLAGVLLLLRAAFRSGTGRRDASSNRVTVQLPDCRIA